MGILENIKTSIRLTGASFGLVAGYPRVMLLPLLTLIAVATLVIAPVSFLVWLHENHPETAMDFWKALFWIPVDLWNAGDYQAAVSGFIIEGYVLYAIWLTFALTAVFYFTTAGMHVATLQIRTGKPDLSDGFSFANRNFGRIFLFALFNATIFAWIKYLLKWTFRLTPFVGKWIGRGVKLALTAVSYLMLPIVLYERAGPWNAMRSAWTNVKETWSGLVIGTGITFGAIWALFNVFAYNLLRATLDLEPWAGVIIAVVSAGIVYSLAMSVSAALRATLYWYATTGEVPDGFNANDLPTIERHGSLTGAQIITIAGAPTASATASTHQPTIVQGTEIELETGHPSQPAREAQQPPSQAPASEAKPSGGDGRRLACPECRTVIVTHGWEQPTCPTCGFTGPARPQS